jgi:hypothetical protein
MTSPWSHSNRLTIPQILAWADVHHARTGEWPRVTSGPIAGTGHETWAAVNAALRIGLRGLPGGSSLARLLAEQRNRPFGQSRPPLTAEQILAWADAHHQRTGNWPGSYSGPVRDAQGENWTALNQALATGVRGLPGGTSLASLLAEHRGKRKRTAPPPLTEEQILRWADAHYARTGSWPQGSVEPIPDAPGETWNAISCALRLGRRGLPGGSSLTNFLAARRGAPVYTPCPDLSLPQVLAWADAFHARTGRWPHTRSGPIAEAPGASWHAVNTALRDGVHGLPGGSTLAALLAAERGVRNLGYLPRLRQKEILAWADAHFARTGKWPTQTSGPIPEAPWETWKNVDAGLRIGFRGLRGGSSVAQLLARHRRKRPRNHDPSLTVAQVLDWADRHHRRTGAWPHSRSGPVPEAFDLTWGPVDDALRYGFRGLPGGSGLWRLLAQERGAPHPACRPLLTEQQILRWARRHRRRTGSWPRPDSGPVVDAPGETWLALNHSLCHGRRGLPGGSTLRKLIQSLRR